MGLWVTGLIYFLNDMRFCDFLHLIYFILQYNKSTKMCYNNHFIINQKQDVKKLGSWKGVPLLPSTGYNGNIMSFSS